MQKKKLERAFNTIQTEKHWHRVYVTHSKKLIVLFLTILANWGEKRAIFRKCKENLASSKTMF